MQDNSAALGAGDQDDADATDPLAAHVDRGPREPRDDQAADE